MPERQAPPIHFPVYERKEHEPGNFCLPISIDGFGFVTDYAAGMAVSCRVHPDGDHVNLFGIYIENVNGVAWVAIPFAPGNVTPLTTFDETKEVLAFDSPLNNESMSEIFCLPLPVKGGAS